VEHDVIRVRTHELTRTRLLGLPGFPVLATGEIGGEFEVLVETD
jgi:hypothetical protein